MGGAPSAPPPPAQQQVSQTAEFPEELKPFIDDILERARTRIESRDEEGFQKFPAPRLAEFSPEQSEAQQGISNIARSGISSDPRLSSSKTYMAPALEATASSRGTFDADTASKFMSPYIQNVIDIQKREARRSGELQNQQIADQAVGAGSYGGSRQAFQESERRRNEAQLLDDIQAKGLQSAFETGSAQFEREKGRDLAAGQQYAGLGEQAPRLALAELGALSGVGAAKQEQGQRALDIGYQEFQEELQYPERTLQEYSSIIRGFPLTPNQFGVTQTATPPPNLTTQLAGALGTGAGAFKAFAKEGGQIKRVKGGLLDIYDGEAGFPTEYNPDASGTTPDNSSSSAVPEPKKTGLVGLNSAMELSKTMNTRNLGRNKYKQKIQDFLTRQEVSEADRSSKEDRDIGLAMIQASAPLLAGDKPLMEALSQAAPTFAGDIGKLRRENTQAKLKAEKSALEGEGLISDVEGQDFAEKLKLYEIDATSALALAKSNAALAKANRIKPDVYKAFSDSINKVLEPEIKGRSAGAQTAAGQALKIGLEAYTKALKSNDPSNALTIAQEAINNRMQFYFDTRSGVISPNNPSSSSSSSSSNNSTGKVLKSATGIGTI